MTQEFPGGGRGESRNHSNFMSVEVDCCLCVTCDLLGGVHSFVGGNLALTAFQLHSIPSLYYFFADFGLVFSRYFLATDRLCSAEEEPAAV